MAKGGRTGDGTEKKLFRRLGDKRTTIGNGKMAMSKMNKHKRRSYKRYRGQGRP